MEETLRTFVQDHLYLHVVLVAVSVAAMLGAMAVDLVTGVRKARQNGVATTSKGLKKTADKAVKYFTPYIVLVCADLICSVVISFPVFSMIWAAYCVCCEFRSVREKAWQKAEIEAAAKTLSVIIENKDELAAAAAKIILGNTQTPTNKDINDVKDLKAPTKTRKSNAKTYKNISRSSGANNGI